jgi:glucosamine--fructose-6-phosphate aminotransferase (isomerizing)
MSFENYATYCEITNQTPAWAQAVDLVRGVALGRSAADYDQVIFTGCGSSYYLSLAGAAIYQELTGHAARGVPAGELVLNPKSFLTDQRTLLVAASRSGTTSETVRAVESFKRGKRGDVLVISNCEELLSDVADLKIVVSKGQEQSVAQTRSFASMYVAAVGFGARMAARDDLLDAMAALPQAGEQLMREYSALAKELGETARHERFFFLGSGLRYGLACEANLKMKEMSLVQSEPFHFLEFRHGPMSMVNPNTLIVGLVSESNARHEQSVLAEMRALGGTTVSLAEADAEVAFKSDIPEAVRGVLYLPVLQLLAFHRSLAKGLNPDRPNNLTAVIKLEL